MGYLIEQLGNWRFYLVGGFPEAPLSGLALNILMASMSLVLGFVCGCGLGLARVSRRPAWRRPAAILVDTIRSVPAVLLVFWCALFIPSILGRDLPLFWGAVIGLSLNAAAYQAEIVRAGLLAVPTGQIEAALATGMTRRQAVFFVALPQAFRMMIPAFVSCFISLFKDTSVVYIIGIIELIQTGVIISQRMPNRLLASYVCVAIGFYLVCRSMSFIAGILEKRFGVVGIRSTGG
jgi:polar amino acid transport system permease protein